MRRTAALCVLVLGFLCAAASGAQPPPDDAFRAKLDAFLADRARVLDSGDASLEAVLTLYNRFVGSLDLSSLKPTQIARLMGYGLINYSHFGDGGRDWSPEAIAGVRRWLDDRSREGAVAAAALAVLDAPREADTDERLRLNRAALAHPALPDALRTGDVSELTRFLVDGLTDPERVALKDDLAAYLARLPGASPRMAAYADELFAVVRASGALSREQLEPLRLGLMRLAQQAQSDAERHDPSIDGGPEYYAKVVASLTHADTAARLVGRPAPALDLIWSSGDPPLTSLDDLTGSVVVLDFWATWCGPCVASFPSIRALVDHYKGFPVRVLGVTSVQGATFFPPPRGRERARTPRDEFDQMSDYITAMDIRWDIAFSAQDVYNPEYGIQGLPFTVILDPAGVVRHTGLHPGAPLEELAPLIDGLLAEFGLPAPR